MLNTVYLFFDFSETLFEVCHGEHWVFSVPACIDKVISFHFKEGRSSWAVVDKTSYNLKDIGRTTSALTVKKTPQMSERTLFCLKYWCNKGKIWKSEFQIPGICLRPFFVFLFCIECSWGNVVKITSNNFHKIEKKKKKSE